MNLRETASPAPHPEDAGDDCAKEETPEREQVERRRGLPDEDTIVSETTITSPKGRTYRVLRTNQTDPYDVPPEVDRPDED